MFEVPLDLGLGGEALGPPPLALQIIVERERVEDAFEIAASPGVPVPVPHPAGAGCGLESLHRELQPVTQAVSRVETRKSGSDDYDVNVSVLHPSTMTV